MTVNKWRVDPGDSYTLSWMESSSVQPFSDFVVEECTDPQFKDRENYTRYVVRAHSKTLENATSFSHTVRYYRVRTRAWIRDETGQQTEDEVVSNVVRVTLLGTDKSPPPSFPDDPEPQIKKPKTDKKNDKDKNEKEEYPSMGLPDMIVLKITLEPEKPRVGQEFKVHVTIKNAGVFPSDVCQVKIEAAGRQWIVDCEGLKPNYAIDAITPPVIVNDAGELKVHAEIDPFNRMRESRKDNNDGDQTFTILDTAKKPAASSDARGESNASNGGK